MFCQKPVVPRHEDGTPRFVVLERSSVTHRGKPAADKSPDSMQGDVEGIVDRLFPGPKVGQVLQHCPEPHCDRSALVNLRRLLESNQCDVVVVEDRTRVGRNTRLQLSVIQGLVDYGVRFISVADRIDTAADDWESACCIAVFKGDLPWGAAS